MKISRFYVVMKKFVVYLLGPFFIALSPLSGNNFQNMNPKEVKEKSQKGNLNSNQLLIISQAYVKIWILENLPGPFFHQQGTFGLVGDKINTRHVQYNHHYSNGHN